MVWKTVRPVDKNVEYRKNVRMRNNRQTEEQKGSNREERSKERTNSG
jgi:hypothetical protein